ncbi:hypothetical protein FIBSPDRAFT_878791 [Athelia psychrophila]|uniref:Uncharacterized protein n=1 Tax=Athelia psychrophila TaxID=1759441 RepID=A0A167UPR6_9AGAM|nr:hypothetical protein FIBSPDRAFT_878791 [Fibularhizoctonia sp. CBS 109695]
MLKKHWVLCIYAVLLMTVQQAQTRHHKFQLVHRGVRVSLDRPLHIFGLGDWGVLHTIRGSELEEVVGGYVERGSEVEVEEKAEEEKIGNAHP